MKYKRIIDFVKRANYNKEIMVLLGYEILEDIFIFDQCKEQLDDDGLWCAAIPILDEHNNIVKFIICIGDEFYKAYKNKETLLKYALLHEIGHVNTYKYNVFESDEDSANWELEAQLWAMKRAKEMGLKYVAKKIWEDFNNWDDRGDIYKLAKDIYIKNSAN